MIEYKSILILCEGQTEELFVNIGAIFTNKEYIC